MGATTGSSASGLGTLCVIVTFGVPNSIPTYIKKNETSCQ